MKQRSCLIFVVDDRLIVAETLVMVLVQAGFRALAFEDPTMALSAATIKHPDVLISDVIMPQMTGVDLALAVLRLHPGCRVLLYSAQIQTDDLLDRAKAEGHELEMLSKPVQPSQILEKLRDLDCAHAALPVTSSSDA
jgi:DNA-binding NtrC family response regulator